MLVFSPFLLIEQQGVFGLDVGDFIIKAQKIMLEIFELEEFLLEGSNDCVFVLGFSLLQQTVGRKVSIHLLIEFYLEINYHSNPCFNIRALPLIYFQTHYHTIDLIVLIDETDSVIFGKSLYKTSFLYNIIGS